MLVDRAHEQIPRALEVFESLMGPADNARLAFSLNSGPRREIVDYIVEHFALSAVVRCAPYSSLFEEGGVGHGESSGNKDG